MIELKNLNITVPGFKVSGINITIESGEFFALLGPTGSGKTLILETIAGLTRPHSGRVIIAGRDVTHLPPEDRNVGMVYQDSALFPHLSVEKNIAYGLRYCSKDNRDPNRLKNLTRQLGISHLSKRSVLNLSGGEKQRVALARALATQPSIILLDEPLSALDSSFREEVRRSLKQLHQTLNMTFLLVTHDFSEALYLADRAAVISRGSLQQVGKVHEIFRYPANPFVAGFVGMKNMFQAELDSNVARIGSLTLFLPNGDVRKQGTRMLGIRPEDVLVHSPSQTLAEPNTFLGRVRNLEASGMQFTINVDVMGTDIRAILDGSRLMEMALSEGSLVNVCLPAERIHLLDPPSVPPNRITTA